MEFNSTVLIFISLFGCIIGSFLNVIIIRVPKGESFALEKSKCRSCKKKLKWVHLIPVISFIALKGRCASCKKKISWQYPLVELAMAVMTGFLFYRYGFTSQFVLYTIFSAFLLVIFMIDLCEYLILDTIAIPAFAVALIGNLLIGHDWGNIIIGIFIGGGFFLGQFILSKGKWIGGGDIRLGAVMGAMLGWKGLVLALLTAYWIGAAVAIILLASHRKKKSDHIPFGTFLSAATFLVLLYSDVIINWATEIFLYR